MSSALEYSLMITSIICLIWAAWEDINARLVRDRIWGVQLAVSVPLLTIWALQEANFLSLILFLVNFVFGIILGVVFFMVGSFGGGDSKALIVLSISSPFYFREFGFKNIDPQFLYPPVLLVLGNMLFLLLFFAIGLLCYNLLRISQFGPLFEDTKGKITQKIGILVSGYRIPSEVYKTKRFSDPAEKLGDDGWHLHSQLFSEPLDDEEFEKRELEERKEALESIAQSGRKYLWVRPQPPGLVFMLLSYLWWILLGSPLIGFFELFT